MPDETHKLQKDPPEGSRKVIERELERQTKEPQGEKKDREREEKKNGERR